MNTKELAAALVELAGRYALSKSADLPAADLGVLFEVVSAAGFKAKEVVPGLLRGRWMDQDGPTGETYPINVFPFKVVDQDGSDDYTATGWLDGIMGVAIGRGAGEVQREIERSVPFEPIQLTAEGDLLREYPPARDFTFLVDHTRDDRQLVSSVGIHEFCESWVDRVGATRTNDALLCRRCHMRVLFPKSIKTYGELRQFLTSELVRVPA